MSSQRLECEAGIDWQDQLEWLMMKESVGFVIY